MGGPRPKLRGSVVKATVTFDEKQLAAFDELVEQVRERASEVNLKEVNRSIVLSRMLNLFMKSGETRKGLITKLLGAKGPLDPRKLPKSDRS